MMLDRPRRHVISKNAGRFRLSVYWRDDDLGTGPCMSVYDPAEVLRYDLFSPAHMHVNNGTATRTYFPHGHMLSEYVELALVDLAKRHPKLAAQGAWVRQAFDEVCRKANRPVG